MKRHKTRYVIPDDLCPIDGVLKDGETPFDAGMVGAYYQSSLEYGISVTPQYSNAGDLVAPVYDDVREALRPSRPPGTFGALKSDYADTAFSFEAGRSIIELPTLEDTLAVADSISNATGYGPTMAGKDHKTGYSSLTYQCKDGSKITYEQAVQLQASFKEHNQAIQKQIDDLIEQSGYQPEYRNGRKVSKAYPQELISKIAALASQKKSITGFSLKIQITGKHTIAKQNGYLRSSSTPEQVTEMMSKLHYKDKTSFLQGIVRVGTLNIPIQSVAQLRQVINILKAYEGLTLNKWPERVRKTHIRLAKEQIG